MEIGRKGGETVGGAAQRGVHGEAAHPRPGVADGGESVQKFVVGGAGTDGGFQTVFQSFGDAADVCKGRLEPRQADRRRASSHRPAAEKSVYCPAA